MLAKCITNAFRSYYAGKKSAFRFLSAVAPDFPHQPFSEINLYIHIPFCRQGCPYCPYNKTDYSKPLADAYFEALHREIDLYFRTIGKVNLLSVYFGGGSPAIVPEQIALIMRHLQKCFQITGPVCIELNPNDCEPEHLKILHLCGITSVSVGVQSFNDRFLKQVGRNYTGNAAIETVQNVKRYFNKVNIDLMFALQGQSWTNLRDDIDQAIALGVNQITTYPLFTFPYSSIGKYKKLSRVKMPGIWQRRKQYYAIYDYLVSSNYQPVSVWSFMSGQGNRYSSVTRDGYLGLGAGAGTHFENGYYLNTFSVKDYNHRLEAGQYPTALKFALDSKRNNLFWLYWRFYDTRIPINEFYQRFSGDKKTQRLISFFTRLGFMRMQDNHWILTRKGSFWLHLAQNHFSLRYINTIWSQALKTGFPDEIAF